jgi:hypothetical protein
MGGGAFAFSFSGARLLNSHRGCFIDIDEKQCGFQFCVRKNSAHKIELQIRM